MQVDTRWAEDLVNEHYLLGAIFSLCSFQALSSTKIQTVQASGFTGYHAYMIFSRATQWSVVNLKVNGRDHNRERCFYRRTISFKMESKTRRREVISKKSENWEVTTKKSQRSHPSTTSSVDSNWQRMPAVMDNISNNFNSDESSCRNCPKKIKKFG